MIDKMRNLLKKYKYALIVLMLIGVIFSVFSNFFKTPYDGLFLYYDDATNQVLRFYQGMWETLRTDGLFKMWDWSNFMGANYIASNSYYNLFSPFTIIMYFFDKDMIPLLLVWMNMLKLLCIGLASFKLVSFYSSKTYVRLTGMLILTFNGWLFCYAKYLFMWDAYFFIILVLLGIEYYIKYKKTLLLFISVVLLGIVNYYFLYMFSFLVVIYFLFRYVIQNGLTLKKYKEVIGFAVVYLLGILGSMVVFLPSIINVLNTPRVDGLDVGLFASLSQISRYLTGFIAPPSIYGSFNGLLDAGFGAAGWNGGMAFYSLMITPLLLPQLLCKKKNNKAILILYIILSLLVVLIPVYYLFQGSLESRWFIIFCIINCYMVCHILDKGIDKKILLVTYVIMLIIPFGLNMVIQFKSIQDVNTLQTTVSLIYKILAIYGIGVGLMVFKKEYLLPIILAIEILMINPLVEEDLSVKKNAYDSNKYNHYEPIEFIKGIDKSMYRVDVMTQQKVVNYPYLNILTSYNMSGFSGYHSIYNYELRDFANRRFSQKDEWYFYNQPYKMGLKNTLANKYWITNINDEVSSINPPIGYKLLRKFDDGYEVYVNEYDLPIMRFAENDIDINEFNVQSVLMQDILFRENVVVENELFGTKPVDEYLSYYGKMLPLENNYIDVETGGIVYIEHNSSKNATKSISMFNEDLVVYRIETTFDYSYIDIPISEQIYSLVLEGDIGESNIYIEKDYESYIKEYSKKQNAMIKSTYQGNDLLMFRATLPKDGYLTFAIPYDKGWTVYLDGNELELINNNGFIATKVDKGSHAVSIKYTTPGLSVGFGFSIGAIIVYIIVSIYKKKGD